jgi:cytochrome P450
MPTLSSLASPPTWPFFGNLHQMRPLRAHAVLEQWAMDYGTPYRVMLGKRAMMVTSSPQSIQMILRERPNGFRRGRPVESVFNEMGISGVFSAEGALWQRQRRLVMKAFDPTHLRAYFPSLKLATDRLQKRWATLARQGAELDLVAELMRYTVDVTAGLAFGVDINTIESEHAHGSAGVLQTHLDKVFPMINRRLTMPYPYWRHVKLPADRALDKHLGEIQKAILGFITLARSTLAAHPERATQPSNLIEALLIARDAEGSEFTDQDVSGNIFTALLAGEDTTANTLAWLTHFLCDQTQWQDKLAAEAQMASEFDALQDMPLHEASIQEAMRLKPVAPMLFFEALADCELDGIELPKNTPITTLMRLPGLDEQRFPNPQHFDPLRWLKPDLVGDVFNASSARKAIMPFGAGPRFCPGRYLAMLEIKMVCAMLVKHFKVSKAPGALVSERYNLSMMPQGLKIRLEMR